MDTSVLGLHGAMVKIEELMLLTLGDVSGTGDVQRSGLLVC